ncbi:hypothetical protein D8796_05745 [Streptococcus cristatus]|uniref:Uncharacterized protein n=2 Tax=Streptococcus cristatus TaxID=45634 RepID=A0A428GUL6_STRCR|nr:hypothetical protein D8795_05590 [Streptococcus cristatus]RSJ79980.1 hypothetical protein D8796_05745 [Streptococcus cristatus]RSJ85618.1 hypothetical protein D8793_06610 [Streptococcus cristatus]RSJ85827.1 hypothetical protein D8794_05855 [Streptococcus cristatus]
MIVTISFIVLGVVYFHQSSSEKESEPKIIKSVNELDINKIKVLGDEKKYILSGADTVLVGGRYLFGRSYKERKLKDSKSTNIEFISFSYYDLDTQKSSTVNVLEKVRKKNKKNDVIRIGLPTFGGPAYKDTIYIEVLEAGKPISEAEKLYYNLGKEDYYSPTDSDKIPSTKELDLISLSMTNLSDRISDIGYYYATDYRSITNSGNVKPDSNINLFSIFPNIEKGIIKGDEKLSMRYDRMGNAEIFDTLLHWFAPKGEETLSGVKIKADYSVDGQEHEIHSYDELKNYYNGKRGELSE